jgi:hypothetical protein
VQNVGLWESWALWWEGASLQGMSLWGMIPLLVVGRIGKIMSFIGGVVAVVDILGPDRIRQWASRTRDGGGAIASTVLDALIRFFDREVIKVCNRTYTVAKIVVRVLFTAAVVGAIFLARLWTDPDSPTWFVVLVYAGIGFGVALVMFFPTVVLFIFAPNAIEKTVENVARVLQHARWELTVRWSGFALIAVGFSLDLLAS